MNHAVYKRLCSALICTLGFVAFETRCGVDETRLAILSDTFDIPELTVGSQGDERSVWFTQYYIHSAPNVDSGVALVDTKGAPLGPKLSQVDWCRGAIEGTVAVSF